MNAQKLRIILMTSLGTALIGIAGVVYFATDMLETATTETTHKKIDAELGKADLLKLKNLESLLEKHQSTVNKAEKIVSDSKQYQYQDQIINDVNRYAGQSGITVSGYDFGINEGNANTKAPSGIKSIPVTINLDSPMSYEGFLKFLKLLETNISKMQVTGVTISPDPDNTKLVINPSVGLLVYVR